MTLTRRQVKIHEAKTHLSRLIEQVEAGAEIILARGNTPVAVLSRYTPKQATKPKPGRLKGRIKISEDFLKPDPELENLFLGGPIFPTKKSIKPGRIKK